MSTDILLPTSLMSFHLPNELWGEVLTYIDDPYHLWVTCRQVSQAFKHEAERIFRVQHLPQMRIQYKMRGGHGRLGKCRVRLKLDIDDTSIDPSCGRFVLKTSNWQISPNWKTEPLDRRVVNFLSEVHRNNTIGKVLNRGDIDALSRKEEYGSVSDRFHQMQVWFQSAKTETPSSWRYANDVEIPDMSLHLNKFVSRTAPKDKILYTKEGHVILNWKSLLTALFSEETFVRRKLAQEGSPIAPTVSLVTLFDTTMATLSGDCASIVRSGTGYTMQERDKPRFESLRNSFIQAAVVAQGSHHTRLYEAAYDARLRKAYAKCGRETPPNTTMAPHAEVGKYCTYIATHVRTLQDFRNENLKRSAEEYWQKRVGTVEFQKPPVQQ